MLAGFALILGNSSNRRLSVDLISRHQLQNAPESRAQGRHGGPGPCFLCYFPSKTPSRNQISYQLSATRQIKFCAGVINLPQQHPATVAAHTAMFDHDSNTPIFPSAAARTAYCANEPWSIREDQVPQRIVDAFNHWH